MANVSSDIGCPQNATFRGVGANEYLGFGVLSFFEDCSDDVEADYLGKDAELDIDFDDDSFTGILKIPFIGKIRLKNGHRI